MKTYDGEPGIVVVLKVLAILGFFSAVVCVFSGLANDGALAAASFVTAMSAAASGLMIWWMAEVVSLLGRIAGAGPSRLGNKAGNKPREKDLESMLYQKPKGRQDEDTEVPKYQL